MQFSWCFSFNAPWKIHCHDPPTWFHDPVLKPASQFTSSIKLTGCMTFYLILRQKKKFIHTLIRHWLQLIIWTCFLPNPCMLLNWLNPFCVAQTSSWETEFSRDSETALSLPQIISIVSYVLCHCFFMPLLHSVCLSVFSLSSPALAIVVDSEPSFPSEKPWPGAGPVLTQKQGGLSRRRALSGHRGIWPPKSFSLRPRKSFPAEAVVFSGALNRYNC